MTRNRSPVALVVLSTILLTPSLVCQGPATQALFSFDSLAAGPFPSDWHTVPDYTNNTHLRVSLPPLPHCQVSPSSCPDLAVLNELDGFNLQPRLSVPFNGRIDATTVTSDTLFLVSLGSTGPGRDDMPWGTVVGIDQVVWDTLSNTLHVESARLLAQHTRFALIVTRGIRDEGGAPVQASDEFRRFRATVREEYKQALLDAIQAAHDMGVPEKDIAVASVFTTLSATAVLEKIRDQIYEASPDPADFLLGDNGERTVFSLDEVTAIDWNRQTKDDPPDLEGYLPINLAPVRTGAVGRVAFGKYVSRDYLVHPGEYIPPVGTRSGTPEMRKAQEIYFNLFLPSGPQPAEGWPVVIFGPTINNDKNVQPLSVLGSLAANGLATIAINAVGQGRGPEGTLKVSRTVGDPVVFPAGGRGVDQNGNHDIGLNEGSTAHTPRDLVFFSDGFRQTAVDLMQLSRVIAVGMDVDGDGERDLDPSRINYFGSSLSSAYGTVFLAVEPGVRTGVLAVPAHPAVISHWSPLFRDTLGRMLADREPPLLNSPGVMSLDGLAVKPLSYPFDDNLPLRERTSLQVQVDGATRIIQSPVNNTIAGAMAIQEFIDRLEWVSQASSAIAYAPRLRASPLSGMSAKSVLYLIAKGDQTATSPTTTALLRAGDLADRAVYYRHDLALIDFCEPPNPCWPRNPHGIAISISNYGDMARAAQQLAGIFFASGGTVDPEPTRYFEFPIPLPLPEGLNFIR